MLLTQEATCADAGNMMGHLRFFGLVLIVLLLSAYMLATESEGARSDETTQLVVPGSIKAEHEELHAELAAAAGSGGRVAQAAREVEGLLRPHFAAEEEYALPPLGLLPLLARGGERPWMADALPMTEKLRANLPRMLEEHRAVGAALERLRRAALEEKKPEAARFAEKLLLHARNEEEVLYPAAILVGEHLRLRLKK